MGIDFKLALAVSIFVATSCINDTPVEAFPTHSDQNGQRDEIKLLGNQVDWVDCSNVEDGVRIPSTTSCSEYYECDHGLTFYFYCPVKHGEEGHQRLYFDPKLQVCNWPSKVECEIDNNNASVANRSIFPGIRPSIDSKQNDGTEPTDDFDCSQARYGEQFPSPTSCSEFYVCVNECVDYACRTFTSNIAYLQRCPMMASGGRLYYDPELKTCNWPSQVDCEITSTSSPTTTTMVTEPSVTTTTSETSVQPESTTSIKIDSTTTEPPTSITTTMEPTTSETQEESTLPDTPTQSH